MYKNTKKHKGALNKDRLCGGGSNQVKERRGRREKGDVRGDRLLCIQPEWFHLVVGFGSSQS